MFTLQLWCAGAVFRSAGRTRDGGSLVGAHSTFYSNADPSAAGDVASTDPDELLSKSPEIAELDLQIKVITSAQTLFSRSLKAF